MPRFVPREVTVRLTKRKKKKKGRRRKKDKRKTKESRGRANMDAPLNVVVPPKFFSYRLECKKISYNYKPNEGRPGRAIP